MVVLSPRDESGTVLLTANRVITADTRTIAAGVLFPAAEAVTGNIFVQVGAVWADRHQPSRRLPRRAPASK